MTPDLDDAERAALVELLTETIASDWFRLSPRGGCCGQSSSNSGSAPNRRSHILHRSPRCGLASSRYEKSIFHGCDRFQSATIPSLTSLG
jgi:hypothetical protein